MYAYMFSMEIDAPVNIVHMTQTYIYHYHVICLYICLIVVTTTKHSDYHFVMNTVSYFVLNRWIAGFLLSD